MNDFNGAPLINGQTDQALGGVEHGPETTAAFYDEAPMR